MIEGVNDEIQKQFQEAAEASQQFLAKLAEIQSSFQKSITEMLQQVAESVKQTDEVVRLSTIRLSELGWTVPHWLDIHQVAELGTSTAEEVDRRFEEIYLSGPTPQLDRAIEELSSSLHLEKWHPLLIQTFSAIKRNEFLVAIPALISILEGFVAQIAVQSKPSLIRETNAHQLAKELIPKDANNITYVLRNSTAAFIVKLYQHSDFSGAPPAFINRHWILHGRASSDWKPVDAIRLVNAMGTLVWLAD